MPLVGCDCPPDEIDTVEIIGSAGVIETGPAWDTDLPFFGTIGNGGGWDWPNPNFTLPSWGIRAVYCTETVIYKEAIGCCARGGV